MEKTEIFEIDLKVFKYKFFVVIGPDKSVISKNFKEYENATEIKNIEEETKRLEAFTFQVCNDISYGSLIWFESFDSMSIGLIVHESSHAVKMLFEHIQADMREHEPFEYILQFLVESIIEIKDKNIQN